MAESRWEMKIGSTVIATDGEYGHIQQVIVDPHQEQVVALLVWKHGLLPAHTIVVPEDAIADATVNEVRLKISLEQMDALPDHKPGTELVVEGRNYVVDDESFAMCETHDVQVGRTPIEGKRKALQLKAGHTVFCRDGNAGKVSLMLMNPGGRVKSFVIHAGHLPGRNLIVPVAWVQELDREDIHLSVEKSALANLPEYDTDSALADGVYETLWADEMLRVTDYREINVMVKNGIVILRGHVITRMNRTRAENAAHRVPGVLDVENHLVVDEDLVIDVAQVLGHDNRTRLESISVGAQNGVITLSGKVGTAALREAAGALAASVQEVRGLANFLDAPNVVVELQEGQVLEPRIGGEAIATDMPVGHVERVIINPHNRRVTAFVLHGHFPDPRYASESCLSDENSQAEKRFVVPIRSVCYETDNSVELNVSSVEIVRNPDFDPVYFVSPPEDWEPPYPYRWGDVLFEKEMKNEPEIQNP